MIMHGKKKRKKKRETLGLKFINQQCDSSIVVFATGHGTVKSESDDSISLYLSSGVTRSMQELRWNARERKEVRRASNSR